jgi:osmotically-inducible protein OsmY
MNGKPDICGCCEGLTAQTPTPVANRPGLSAIAYRIGAHSSSDDPSRYRDERITETAASVAKLRDVAMAHHVRAALRTHGATAQCAVRVTADGGRVELRGSVDNIDQSEACSDIALRIKGVRVLENHLNVAEVTGRKGDGA